MAQEMQRLRADHAARYARVPPQSVDWALYPWMKASGEPELDQLARRFSDEMGHIASDYAAYDAKWTLHRVAAEWDAF